MQAILARKLGGPDVLKLADVPDPHAGSGQVRVRMHAIGVNPYDTYMRPAAMRSSRTCPTRQAPTALVGLPSGCCICPSQRWMFASTVSPDPPK
jgi:NADPH:quinone reductase-like Zn-dependent oxidoreductase